MVCWLLSHRHLQSLVVKAAVLAGKNARGHATKAIAVILIAKGVLRSVNATYEIVR